MLRRRQEDGLKSRFSQNPDSVLGLVGNGLRQDGGIKRVSSHLYFDYYRSADVLCDDAPAEVLEREQYVAISIAVCQKRLSAQSEGLEPGTGNESRFWEPAMRRLLQCQARKSVKNERLGPLGNGA